MAEKENNKLKTGHSYVQWMVASLANLTLLTFGLQEGWVMPTTKILQSDDSPTGYPLSDYEISWIASVICISAIFSVVMFSKIVDAYGRKVGITLIALLQSLGWAVKIFSSHTVIIVIARICCGLAAGGAYNVIPMYVREISNENMRGKLGFIFTLSQTMGVFLAYLMGVYLGYYTVIWIYMTLSILTALLLIKAPEPPAYLVKRGRVDDALTILSLLRGLEKDNKLIQNELDAMKKEEEKYCNISKVSFVDILKNKVWRRGFILVLVLVTIQTDNGLFAILTYAGSIFRSSGVTISPELQALAIPIVMMLSSVISMSCVEKIGRKPLFIAVFSVAAVSLSTLAILILLQQLGISVPGWVPVISVLLYTSAYAGGILSLPSIIVTEMFNFQIRATVMGYLISYAWFMYFVQIFTFTPMAKALGLYSVFFYFAVLNVLGIIVCVVFLPETKGKAVEEIEKDLSK